MSQTFSSHGLGSVFPFMTHEINIPKFMSLYFGPESIGSVGFLKEGKIWNGTYFSDLFKKTESFDIIYHGIGKGFFLQMPKLIFPQRILIMALKIV